MLMKLWQDEGGAIVSAEIVLIGTILVIGVIVGLSAVQDAVVTELADLGGAIGSVNQSYTTGGVTGHHAATGASSFTDEPDSCDTNGTNSRCVEICVAGGAEGTPAVAVNPPPVSPE